MGTFMEELQERLSAMAAAHFPGAALVFGEGSAEQPVLAVIGEAPGAEEEKLRRPFVGKAGKNLDSFLDTLGLARAAVYITNLVKLRPSRVSDAGRVVNRPPSREEVGLFAPFLAEELAFVSPRIIATLGNFALRAVLNDDKATIGQHHGQLLTLPDGQKLFPLYHPASIIYNQSLKEVYAADLEKLRTILPYR